MINYDCLASKYKALGIEVPTKEMIKTEEQILGIKKAGIINTAILDYISDFNGKQRESQLIYAKTVQIERRVAQKQCNNLHCAKISKNRLNNIKSKEKYCGYFTKWKIFIRIYCKTVQMELKLMQTVA